MMRQGPWICLVCVLGMTMAWGCTMTSEQVRYTEIGAGSGALVGGAIGCGIAASIDRDDPTSYAIGCPIGVGVGALLGGVIGYATAPSPTPPPPAATPLAPSSPPPPPPLMSAPQKIILRGVHFDFDKAVIRPVDMPVLDEVADTLKANPATRVGVNGYCDAIGSEAYNLKLSQRRAEAVAQYLQEHGVEASRLTPQGFGKTNFVASNRTADGRAQNRRVELMPADQ